MGWTRALARWLGVPAKTGTEAVTTPLPDVPTPTSAAEAVLAALRSVNDPELGLNIVDLGLVYAVEATAGRVRADITLTTPTCPLGEIVASDALAAIRRALPNITNVQVQLVWAPPWKPSMMSDDARRQLGW